MATITAKKTATKGYEITRYEVTMLRRVIGEVYSVADTTGRKAAGNTHFTSTRSVVRWDFTGRTFKGAMVEDNGFSTRREALARLVFLTCYNDGRESGQSTARRMVERSGL